MVLDSAMARVSLVSSCERCRLWLLDGYTQRFLIWKLHYLALVCVLRVKDSAFLMEYCLVFNVLIVSVWHRRWSLAAQSIALWFSKTSSVR